MPVLNKYKQNGFTIIEVMIVLAIAGIILLITFQAIPTLQRNSRNNERKQDVSAILEAVSRFQLNNSGAMPDDCGGGGGGEPECTEPGELLERTQLSYYYDPDSSTDVRVQIRTLSAGDSSINNPGDLNRVLIYNYQRCNVNSTGDSTPNAAGFRDIVALFAIETRSGPANQCLQL